jgi:hypothetical protein
MKKTPMRIGKKNNNKKVEEVSIFYGDLFFFCKYTAIDTNTNNHNNFMGFIRY